MKIKLGKIHLYLGALFAPLIALYTASGLWQIFNFHKASKDATYKPPEILSKLSGLHQNQTYPGMPKGFELFGYGLFHWFSALMCVGLLIMALLGVILAFQRTPKQRWWQPAIALAAGIILPVAMIFLVNF